MRSARCSSSYFLKTVARIELGLRESLHLKELSLRGAVPDASGVSFTAQRLEQLPDDGDAPVVEASLAGWRSY
eukprot:2032257-Pleurochrysis_carterae.AAC.1